MRTGPAKPSADSSSCCSAFPFASSTGTVGMLLGLFGFLLLRLGLLHAFAHQQERPGVARDRAAQENEILFGDDAHHRQVEHGAAVAAPAARELVARPDARGIGTGPRGAPRAGGDPAVALGNPPAAT